jgi:hypothetical protein
MRQIETKMCDAVLNGKSMSRDNTTVTVTRDEHGQYHSAMVTLHGHEIAHYFWSGYEKTWVIRLTDARWRTVTTKSRLNALLEGVGQGDRLRVYQQCKGCQEMSKGEPMHMHKWLYTMGAHDYVWNGEATFMAKEPTE